jgi:ubiquinone/menaquinone biosynthesis C-methylase UbiE
MNDKAYFSLYEDRYRRLREQGIEEWIADPAENEHIIESVNNFLNYARCHPAKTSIIEFGCGEGHLAEYLLECGYRYLGVDISESAILQARKKTGAKGQNAFLAADVTDLYQVTDSSFNVAIDNQCLHMLVTDEHRKKYLAEVKRILKSDGKVYFRENIQQEEFKVKISSFREFVEKCYGDYSKLYDYPAYAGGKHQTIKLPRIPARSNNEQGYRKELEKAGFIVENYSIKGEHCIIYARVK